MPDLSKVMYARSTFWWVKKEKASDDKIQKTHSQISLKEVIRDHGMPATEVLTCIRGEIAVRQACLGLPLTLLLVCSYAAMVIYHDNAPVVNAVEDSLVNDVKNNANFAYNGVTGFKNLEDVNSHTDFWSWMSRGFVPYLWQQEYPLSELRTSTDTLQDEAGNFKSRAINGEDRGVVAKYNRIVMGVRLSQERYGDNEATEPTECRGTRLQKLYQKPCVGGGGKYELEPEKIDARFTINPQRIRYLYIHDDVGDIQTQVMQLQNEGWLDEKTQKVEVAYAVYNGEYGLHTIITCNFFWSRGGRVWKRVIPQSSWANWYSQWSNFIFDGLWFISICFIITFEVFEVLKVVKESSGKNSVCSEYWQFWNVVDWVSVFSALLILYLVYNHLKNVRKVNRDLSVLSEIDQLKNLQDWRAKGAEYIENLLFCVQYLRMCYLMLFVYPCIIFLRLLKTFHSQERFSTLTRTLIGAAPDLAHFAFIVGSVFIMYVVGAVVLFGREEKAFTTAWRSANTCFRIMQGDWDWDQMGQIGRLDAMVWFLPFSILLFTILMNMLIAILMEAYQKTVREIGNAETFWASMYRIVGEKLNRRGFIIDIEDVSHTIQLYEQDQEEAADEAEERERKLKESVTGHFGEVVVEEGSPEKQRLAGVEADDEAEDHNYLSEVVGDTPMLQAAKNNDPTLKKLNLLTTGKMKELFHRYGLDMKKEQRRDLLIQAVNTYHAHHKEDFEMDDLLNMLGKIDYRVSKAQGVVNTIMTRECATFACFNPREVSGLHRDIREEIQAARQACSGWLPHDPHDQRLNETFVRELARSAAPHAHSATPPMRSDGFSTPASKRSMEVSPEKSHGKPAASPGGRRQLSHHLEPRHQATSLRSLSRPGQDPRKAFRHLDTVESMEKEAAFAEETVKDTLDVVKELHEHYAHQMKDKRAAWTEFKKTQKDAGDAVKAVRRHKRERDECKAKFEYGSGGSDDSYSQIRQLIKEKEDLEVQLLHARMAAVLPLRVSDKMGVDI